MSLDRLAFLGVAALFVLSMANSARAGWDSVPYQSGSPIHAEGALLLHDDGTAVQAFSASTSRWTAIAPTGSNILGTGDWTGLVELPDRLVAYSSRLNSTAVLGITSSPELVRVDDAVLLTIHQGVTGGKIAHAYSADTNTFSSLPYTPTGNNIADDVAVSRFVIVLRSAAGIHGFSARHGSWVLLTAASSSGEPQADGNVGLVELPPPVGAAYPSAAAFSGVTGAWSVSPLMYSGSGRLNHNVAYVEATDTSGHFRASAYSAYNDRWITSTVVRALASQGVYLSDNHVTLQSIMPAEPGLEAIGARPGLNWATYANRVVLFVPPPADHMFANDTLLQETVSFSGICDGSFSSMAYGGGFFSAGVTTAHVAYASDGALQSYGYSPRFNSWSAHPAGLLLGQIAKDAVIDALDNTPPGGAVFTAYSSRWGHWSQGYLAWPAGTYQVSSAGSLVARQRTVAPDLGDIVLYDERCDFWAPAFNPGGVADLTAGRNLLLAALQSGNRHVFGYSVQRGNWIGAATAASGAPVLPPATEENVGWFVDSAGVLFAFGSHGDLHSWYQYPNGTEFQATGLTPIGSPPSPFGITFAGEPGEQVLLLISLNQAYPGISVGSWLNPLCLDPVGLSVIGPLGAIGPIGLLPVVSQLGTRSTPICAQIWLQGAFTGGTLGKRLGIRCEPLPIF